MEVGLNLYTLTYIYTLYISDFTSMLLFLFGNIKPPFRPVSNPTPCLPLYPKIKHLKKLCSMHTFLYTKCPKNITERGLEGFFFKLFAAFLEDVENLIQISIYYFKYTQLTPQKKINKFIYFFNLNP